MFDLQRFTDYTEPRWTIDRFGAPTGTSRWYLPSGVTASTDGQGFNISNVQGGSPTITITDATNLETISGDDKVTTLVFKNYYGNISD